MIKRYLFLKKLISSIALFLALSLIGFYRLVISPVLSAFGVKCRHSPSCSDYAQQAFKRHGVWPGFWLSLSRLSRCHPWGSYGFDDVPHTLPTIGWRPWRYGDWRWGPKYGNEKQHHSDNDNR